MSISVTTITGTVARIDNCGSIVVISLLTKRRAQFPVYFEHRMFQHLLDGEGCSADDLIGRRASLTDDTLVFLD